MGAAVDFTAQDATVCPVAHRGGANAQTLSPAGPARRKRRTLRRMVIVIGTIIVAPTDRDAFIAGRIASMTRSRAEAGCLQYALTPDPIEAGLVVLTERWADQASLDVHIAAARAHPAPAPGVDVARREIMVYQADDGRPL